MENKFILFFLSKIIDIFPLYLNYTLFLLLFYFYYNIFYKIDKYEYFIKNIIKNK